MFPIFAVDSRQAESLEPLGTKRKFWLDDRSRLFKAEERGTGEDWAEKLACELCELLGLPHVHYELAHDVHLDVPGVVCPNMAPPPSQLRLGNQLLQERDSTYPQGTKYHVRQHTVGAVAGIVGGLQQAPAAYCAGLPSGIGSALDVYIGYVMLDVWIANQDRHHENWGALLEGSSLRLAPSFDHGASMARNLSDEERAERMASRDHARQMPAFARRARSAFYADPSQSKTLHTLAAWQAFSHHAPAATTIWLNRLGAVEAAMIRSLIDQVPLGRMSQRSRDFTQMLLIENQRRLLAGEDG